MELEKNVDGEDVLKHLALNYSGYYGQRERVVEIAGYLAGKLESLRPSEASAARVLRDLVRNQRM
jgi:putative DNA methylase